MPVGQTLDMAPGRRGVDGDGLLVAKASQVVRPPVLGLAPLMALGARPGLSVDQQAEIGRRFGCDAGMQAQLPQGRQLSFAPILIASLGQPPIHKSTETPCARLLRHPRHG